ncbi:MAG: VWA domain-containing protein [Chlorobiaceae bacterium]
MTLAWPEYIGFILLLIPLAVILGYGVIRQLQVHNALVSPHLVNAMIPGVSIKTIILKKVMIFFGIAFLLIALTGPILSCGDRPVLRKGADLVFVIDVSNSMRATDVAPDRLTQSKYEISRISRAVKGGRQAIILFAAKPFVQCPLTIDQDVFDALLGMASPDLIETQGTVFRSALELAETLLAPASERYSVAGIKGEKIIVLLSDGEDHHGDFLSEGRRLKKSGIHFFVIGVGQHHSVSIPLGVSSERVKLDDRGRVVMTSFKQKTLQTLASESGGLYFRSSANHFVYNDVSSMINRIVAASRWLTMPVEREPLYYYFLGFGLFLLIAEAMIGTGKLKR